MSLADFLIILLLIAVLLRLPSSRSPHQRGENGTGPGVLLQPGLKVRIEELSGPFAPYPKPLENGFSKNRAYVVWGIYSPSETAEAYALLVNDRNELWFIPTRHLRAAVECANGKSQNENGR